MWVFFPKQEASFLREAGVNVGYNCLKKKKKPKGWKNTFLSHFQTSENCLLGKEHFTETTRVILSRRRLTAVFFHSRKYKNIPTGSDPSTSAVTFAPFRNWGIYSGRYNKKDLFTLLVRTKHQRKAVLVTGTTVYSHPHPRQKV